MPFPPKRLPQIPGTDNSFSSDTSFEVSPKLPRGVDAADSNWYFMVTEGEEG
ncbi:MAG: hypothetical protein ACLRMZ_22360 [Blautia marasmi]